MQMPLHTVPSRCQFAAAALVLLAAAGVTAEEADPGGEVQPKVGAGSERDVQAATSLFSEASASVGLDFVHFNGMSGALYLPEMMGGGGALFDYDNDGDLDVYLVQGHVLGSDKSLADMVFRPKAGQRLSDRLYRNQLTETGRLHFVDVTEQSGIRAEGYGMGVAAADFDNDGWTDLYITNFGPNQLLHNEGDGTFSDVTSRAGLEDPRWSVSAAALDFDRDGWLDLFVGNYVNFNLANHRPCFTPAGARDYCSPLSYEPVPNALYVNRRDGTFQDISTKAKINHEFGGALGVVTADFNNDGWADVYVANDGRPNQLWLNQKNGTFQDEAFLSGAAVNMDGAAEASMGVDAADFDGDGDEDLFMTHLLGESNTLYVNDGTGWFEDRSLGAGLAAPSQGYTAFGTAWFDCDNDGWLDIFIANGEVKTIPALARAGDPYPLHQPNQLYANLGNGRFREATGQAGPALKLSEVSRGAVFGDVDNDGDVDVLVTNNSGPARLLLNNVGDRKHWLGLRLLTGKRDALGARVAVYPMKGSVRWRRVGTDGSYASANDPRVLVGLGDVAEVGAVRVQWPAGGVEEWRGLPVDRYNNLREGQGTQTKAP